MADVPGFSLAFSRALGKVVVHLRGVLDAYAAPDLEAGLVDIIDGQGNRQVVLDLRDLTGVDAAGVRVIEGALHRMADGGGELLLSGPREAVAAQLRAFGLAATFGITPEWTHPARGGIGAARRWRDDPA